MHLFIDFDGTITQSDTIDALVQNATRATGNHDFVYKYTWTTIVKAWENDMKAYKREHPFPSPRKLSEVLAWLEGQRAVEEASIQKINAYNIFKGADSTTLFNAGRQAVAEGQVKLRKGFREFIQHLERVGIEVTIVSVNWSEDWIRGCISPATPNILSNTIDSTGKIVPSKVMKRSALMLTGTDKAQEVMLSVRGTPDGESGSFSYIGDSLTDLQCLIECKNGIVMTDSPEQSDLYQAMVDLSHEVPHVSDQYGRRFAWARDFDEFLQFYPRNSSDVSVLPQTRSRAHLTESEEA
jgi:2-hydroxy-3-keto-5-methylthiopentenyl-1-phosphate phosphatase